MCFHGSSKVCIDRNFASHTVMVSFYLVKFPAAHQEVYGCFSSCFATWR
jgi:hypothetical protein